MGSGERAGGGSSSAHIGPAGSAAHGLAQWLVLALLALVLVHRLPSGGDSGGGGGERVSNSGGEAGGADSSSSSRQLASHVGSDGTASAPSPRNRSCRSEIASQTAGQTAGQGAGQPGRGQAGQIGQGRGKTDAKKGSKGRLSHRSGHGQNAGQKKRQVSTEDAKRGTYSPHFTLTKPMQSPVTAQDTQPTAMTHTVHRPSVVPPPQPHGTRALARCLPEGRQG